MNPQKKDHKNIQHGVNNAPWQRTVSRVLSPIEEFIHNESAGSILLVLATIVALFVANSSAFSGFYQQILHAPLSLTLSNWGITMSLHHWVNDGLMAIFFFVVGLELKREILVGELSNIRQASLPIIAAIGGMLAPALIYAVFSSSAIQARGWGIPMATDIAFAVGALILLGNKVPKSLVTFLIALAIADDLGAVLVIALFYTEQIVLNWLLICAGLVCLLFALNLSGIRSPLPYFIVAVVLWYAMLQSGVHATLAGVLGALTIPMRSKYDPAFFVARINEQASDFVAHQHNDDNLMVNDKLHNIAENIEKTVIGAQAPLQRLEQFWHIPVAFLIIPVFAFFNAGIVIKLDSIGQTFTQPVLLGVLSGLLIGKFVGITGACWIALKLKIGQLPTGVRFSQIAALSFVAGIGFTMSIFIAELAFKEHADELLFAKTGVITGSLLSGVIGIIWLWVLGRGAGKQTAAH